MEKEVEKLKKNISDTKNEHAAYKNSTEVKIKEYEMTNKEAKDNLSKQQKERETIELNSMELRKENDKLRKDLIKPPEMRDNMPENKTIVILKSSIREAKFTCVQKE